MKIMIYKLSEVPAIRKRRLRGILDKYLKNVCKATRYDIPVDMKPLSFEQKYKYFCLIRIFKYSPMILGPYFKNKFEISSTVHQYNTKLFLN